MSVEYTEQWIVTEFDMQEHSWEGMQVYPTLVTSFEEACDLVAENYDERPKFEIEHESTIEIRFWDGDSYIYTMTRVIKS